MFCFQLEVAQTAHTDKQVAKWSASGLCAYLEQLSAGDLSSELTPVALQLHTATKLRQLCCQSVKHSDAMLHRSWVHSAAAAIFSCRARVPGFLAAPTSLSAPCSCLPAHLQPSEQGIPDTMTCRSLPDSSVRHTWCEMQWHRTQPVPSASARGSDTPGTATLLCGVHGEHSMTKAERGVLCMTV